MKTSFANNIYSKKLISSQIDYRLKKSRKNASSKRHMQFGLNIQMLSYHKSTLAKKLAKSIKKNEYVLEPAIQREVFIGDKLRLLYRQTITDGIVTSTAAAILNPIIKKRLSKRVFSYLVGRSSVQVLRELQIFIAQHKNSTDKIYQGLYVLKRDVANYGESIPTDNNSRLWTLLQEAYLLSGGMPQQHPLANIVKQSICRKIVTINGESTIMQTGTPTGSPLQPLINNIYLTDMDEHLQSIEGGFYSRYGDDFVFIHADHQVVKSASEYIDKKIKTLKLKIKDEKRKNYYITIPGKKSSSWPQSVNTTGFNYLGCNIKFTGNISLKKTKKSSLMNDLKIRIASITNLLKDEPQEIAISAMCTAISAALNPAHPLATKSAQLLRQVVDDKVQLKHIDYQIALMIVKAITKSHSVKSFRNISYKSLRQHGLVSLVVSKYSHKKRNNK